MKRCSRREECGARDCQLRLPDGTVPKSQVDLLAGGVGFAVIAGLPSRFGGQAERSHGAGLVLMNVQDRQQHRLLQKLLDLLVNIG